MKRRYLYQCLMLITVIFVTAICYTEIVFALAPPTNEMIVKMKQEGTYEKNVRAAYTLGNNKVSNNLIQAFKERQEELMVGRNATNTPPQIPPAWQMGMSPIGEKNILTILVDFPDYPHDEKNQTVSKMEELMYGSENPSSPLYPYESLAAYYERSSYGKLKLSGKVWGWYRAPKNSTYYAAQRHNNNEDSYSYDELIESAVHSFVNQGNDITQYDNDHDGVIDAIYLMWTAPEGDWATYWWACATRYQGDEKFQGKIVRRVVWMPYGDGDIWSDASTQIHEFGHVLGLPDLYDYDIDNPPNNCMGDLDMMDLEIGDHNAFSKFLLGWLEPTVVGTGSGEIRLRPTSEYPDAVLIMPNANLDACNEYYIAQYRKGTKNDMVYPYTDTDSQGNVLGDGLVIWHIDATLDDSGFSFKYDNSYSERPFVYLVSRENSQDIKGHEIDFWAAGKDFYRNTTHAFSPVANQISGNRATSDDWEQKPTGITINNISMTSNSLTATYSVDKKAPPNLIYKEYDKSNRRIVLTFDCLLTPGVNLSKISVNGKNIGVINCSATVSANKIFLMPNKALGVGNRYDIFIPQDAVKNSNDMACAAFETALVVPADKLYHKEGIELYDANNNLLSPETSVFIRKSDRMPIFYFTEEQGDIGYGFSITNNSSYGTTIQPILAYYVNGILEKIEMGRKRYIPEDVTAWISGDIQNLPENYVADCTVKLFIWDDMDTLRPVVSAFTIQ